jgi:hypothetical protein
MKSLLAVMLLSAIFCPGCGCSTESIAKSAIEGNYYIAYVQDKDTGVVFIASAEYSGYVTLVPIPTDQIDAVKHKVRDYKEPLFLTQWHEEQKVKHLVEQPPK